MMPPWLGLLASAVAAYLMGSIPCSLLIAKGCGGIDLRKHGSGNVGATNVARTLGARWGAVALTLDALKGILPVLMLPVLIPMPETFLTHQRVLCGVLAVLGHMFPVWIGFRGGKGVATALGAVCVLAPWSTLIAFGAFALLFAWKRIVSLASITAAVTFAIGQCILGGASLWSETEWSLGLFSIAVPLLIIVRHRGNIVRLLRGEERPLVTGGEGGSGRGEEGTGGRKDQ
jgi:acyl phosphate:glycerol-3-phosphate acyltransferase